MVHRHGPMERLAGHSIRPPGIRWLCRYVANQRQSRAFRFAEECATRQNTWMLELAFELLQADNHERPQ
eukprot:2776515-Amphidinium_carterae.1